MPSERCKAHLMSGEQCPQLALASTGCCQAHSGLDPFAVAGDLLEQPPMTFAGDARMFVGDREVTDSSMVPLVGKRIEWAFRTPDVHPPSPAATVQLVGDSITFGRRKPPWRQRIRAAARALAGR